MKRYFALIALLAVSTAQAWNDCKYSKDIDVTLDLAGSEELAIAAAAGELKITGHSGTTEARARGKVCVSEKDWLEQSELLTSGGSNARIEVALPDISDGWSLMGNRYASMDLEIDVPDNLALDIRDSSGEIDIRGTGPLTVQDSSGEIEIKDTRGGVVLEDSSGDIDLRDIGGDVLVRRDSSGSIYGRNIEGSVRVEKDSSGEIHFEDVTGDFVVERDSSGDIVAETIGGDFRVEQDGSGDIVTRDVSGEVKIPERG